MRNNNNKKKYMKVGLDVFRGRGYQHLEKQ